MQIILMLGMERDCSNTIFRKTEFYILKSFNFRMNSENIKIKQLIIITLSGSSSERLNTTKVCYLTWPRANFIYLPVIYYLSKSLNFPGLPSGHVLGFFYWNSIFQANPQRMWIKNCIVSCDINCLRIFFTTSLIFRSYVKVNDHVSQLHKINGNIIKNCASRT